jgi:hypothetical protein
VPWSRTEFVVAGMVAWVLVGGRAAAQTSGRPGEDEPRWGTVQVAPFVGAQFGGSVHEPSGRNASFDVGLDYGGTVHVRVGQSWSVEVLYSRQDTELPGSFDATVERYMAGVVEERDYGRTRFFGVALMGATRFVPGSSGYGSTALFTIGVGLGVKHLFTDHLGLRADLRGFYAITESGGGLFCSGGCLFTFSGSGLAQGDASAGVVLAF